MKARIENNTIKIYGSLPQDFENILNFRNADEETVKSKGFYDVVEPIWNPETQILGSIYFNEVSEIFTYPVTDKTPEQIKTERIFRINRQAEAAENRINDKLLKKLLEDKLEVLQDEEAVEYRTMYKPFKIGILLETDEKIYNPADDKLYRVLVGHTTALEWLPENTPTLFVEVFPPGVIPDWKQPTGAHDSYQVGNKVKHGGFT